MNNKHNIDSQTQDIHTHIYIYIYVYVYVYVCVYIYIYIHIHRERQIYVCVCMCVYIYIYIQIDFNFLTAEPLQCPSSPLAACAPYRLGKYTYMYIYIYSYIDRQIQIDRQIDRQVLYPIHLLIIKFIIYYLIGYYSLTLCYMLLYFSVLLLVLSQDCAPCRLGNFASQDFDICSAQFLWKLVPHYLFKEIVSAQYYLTLFITRKIIISITARSCLGLRDVETSYT